MCWDRTRWGGFSLYFMSHFVSQSAHPSLLFKLWHGCVFTGMARLLCWTNCQRYSLLSPQLSPVLKLAEAAEMLSLWLSAWQSLSSILLTPPTLLIQIMPLLLCTGEQIWWFSSLYSWCPQFLILVRMEKCRVVHPTGRYSVLLNVTGLKLKFNLQSGKHEEDL